MSKLRRGASMNVSKLRPPRFVVLHKERGETPLEALAKWKTAHPAFANVSASYAGRLDPMAEGKLLVLLGDECKKQDLYTKLDKEYVIEVLLDLKTDTGDVLGMVEAHLLPVASTAPSPQQLHTVLRHEIGSRSHRYPIFSSKTVHGKPLFLYALEGKLDTITIPEHIETIYDITLLGTQKITSSELKVRIEQLLAKVPRSDEPSKLLGADFRQDAVRVAWQELFARMPARTFTILRLRVSCSSGTYMRTLAERIGASLGTSALALSINRAKVGKCFSFGPIVFWYKSY